MQFLYPNVFYMMFIPLIVLIGLVLTSKETIQQYFSKEILDKLSVGGQILNKTARNILFFITLILFIFALGRPVMNEKEQSLQQNLIPIVIALDVSKSMLATDIYPNRISLAKEKLKHIIQIAQNSTIGIVLFAKDSFILSPITEDFVSLKYIVENLDTNLDFTNGSNIYATLEATSYMLEEFKVKNLIILSDGGNDNSYDKELEFAKETGIEIYSIGLATKKGSPIPHKNGYLTDKNGNIVSVKLNESIKNLSLKSGGGYIDFTNNQNDIEAIIQRINTQSKKEKLTTQKVKIYTELFYYPLGLALFVLLITLSSFPTIKFKTNKNTLKSLILLVLFSIIPINSEANIFEFKNIDKANQLYKDKKYKDSSDEYKKVSSSPQSLYNLGNSLYKDKKYKEAIETYEKITTDDTELKSKILHNLGNSYAQSKNLEKAKESYEKSLKIKEDKETKENLEIVKKELKKKKKEKNKDGKKQNKKNKKKNDKDKKNKDSTSKKNNKNGDKKNKDKKQEELINEDTKVSSDSTNDKKNNKDKNDAKGKGQSKQVKKENISDMEEKKWLNILKKEKTPILLRKVKTNKESNSDKTQPW